MPPLDQQRTSYRSNPLLTDLDGAPAVTDALDPHFAFAPIATGRDFGIAGTISLGRRRTIGVRRRRIVTGRRRRRRRRVISRWRTVGDGAADDGASGDAADYSRADGAAITAGIRVPGPASLARPTAVAAASPISDLCMCFPQFDRTGTDRNLDE